MKNEDCYAYVKKSGKSECYALTKMDCENCHFYKLKSEITIEEIEKQMLDKEFKTKGAKKK